MDMGFRKLEHQTGVNQLLVSLLLSPEPSALLIHKSDPGTSKGPHLQDPCLVHVAPAVPSTGLDIEPELSKAILDK